MGYGGLGGPNFQPGTVPGLYPIDNFVGWVFALAFFFFFF